MSLARDGRSRWTCLCGNINAVDPRLHIHELVLEVRGDPHGAQQALPREDRVRV